MIVNIKIRRKDLPGECSCAVNIDIQTELATILYLLNVVLTKNSLHLLVIVKYLVFSIFRKLLLDDADYSFRQNDEIAK